MPGRHLTSSEFLTLALDGVQSVEEILILLPAAQDTGSCMTRRTVEIGGVRKPGFQDLFRRPTRDGESHQPYCCWWRASTDMCRRPVKNPATVRAHLGSAFIVGSRNERFGGILFQFLPEYLIPSSAIRHKKNGFAVVHPPARIIRTLAHGQTRWKIQACTPIFELANVHVVSKIHLHNGETSRILGSSRR